MKVVAIEDAVGIGNHRLVAGKIYDVEERISEPTFYFETHNGCAWYRNRFNVLDIDIRTCIKCRMTNPPSDEECVPCLDDKHEWVGND